ncbi:hypothetical protein ABC337_04815 [Arthrobacter sp. 1P04PC]|uniref:hypothetical protein n=1 Tax=unclassified Arthrobacter TaxID=235627 RepID=UPI0039A11D4C
MSKTSTRLAGHELHGEGAAHDKRGARIYQGTGGWGFALCSCGSKSDYLTSGNARKQWHRDHKDKIRTAEETR